MAERGETGLYQVEGDTISSYAHQQEGVYTIRYDSN